MAGSSVSGVRHRKTTTTEKDLDLHDLWQDIMVSFDPCNLLHT